MADADYYKSLADKNRDKRDRLKEAVRVASGYITTARNYQGKVRSETDPTIWKGNSANKFDDMRFSLNSTASKFISQMDEVRDGYNTEQAAANTSFLSFLSKWKAAIQNEFN